MQKQNLFAVSAVKVNGPIRVTPRQPSVVGGKQRATVKNMALGPKSKQDTASIPSSSKKESFDPLGFVAPQIGDYSWFKPAPTPFQMIKDVKNQQTQQQQQQQSWDPNFPISRIGYIAAQEDPMMFQGMLVSAMMDKMIGQKQTLADTIMNADDFLDFFVAPSADIGQFHESYKWQLHQK